MASSDVDGTLDGDGNGDDCIADVTDSTAEESEEDRVAVGVNDD